MANALCELPKLEFKNRGGNDYVVAMERSYPYEMASSFGIAGVAYFVSFLASMTCFVIFTWRTSPALVIFEQSLSPLLMLGSLFLLPLVPAFPVLLIMERSRKKKIVRVLKDLKKHYLWKLGEAIKTCNLQIDIFNERLTLLKLGSSEQDESQLIAIRARLDETRQVLQKRIWFEDRAVKSFPSPNFTAISNKMQEMHNAERELSFGSAKPTLLLESSEYREALAEVEDLCSSSKDK